MKTYSASSGIKYDDVKQSRMETLAVHMKRFAQLMDSLKKEYEPEVNPKATTMKRPRPTTGSIGPKKPLDREQDISTWDKVHPRKQPSKSSGPPTLEYVLFESKRKEREKFLDRYTH